RRWAWPLCAFRKLLGIALAVRSFGTGELAASGHAPNQLSPSHARSLARPGFRRFQHVFAGRKFGRSHRGRLHGRTYRLSWFSTLGVRRRRNAYVNLLGDFAGAEKIRFRKDAASGYLTGFRTVRFSSTIFVLRDCPGITVEINKSFYLLPQLL